jgi:hypothetical protein
MMPSQGANLGKKKAHDIHSLLWYHHRLKGSFLAIISLTRDTLLRTETDACLHAHY